ncbi:hypothetical protein MPSEU_000014300 [Mayamaea pseudoterrestris]|nr:hypothetical protein MPSEU_000014300 [Mayamaea pseudoterrestris]
MNESDNESLPVDERRAAAAAHLSETTNAAGTSTTRETATSNDAHFSKLQQQQEQEQDEWLVSCRCESAKAFSTLLSCLRHAALGASSAELAGLSQAAASHSRSRSSHSKANTIQPVTVFCSPSSLTFHAHGAITSKQLQASVDMPAGLFSLYRVAQSDDQQNNESGAAGAAPEWQAGGEFCVNLHTLLECLHVLGTHNNQLERTKLCFSYNMTQELFKLELLQPDSGVLVTAAIPGMVAPDHEAAGDSLAHAFRSSGHAARMIVKSDVLKDVLAELEGVSGATNATVVLGKNKNGLELATCGSWSEVLVSIPAKGTHVVSWEPPRTPNPPIRTYSLKALLASLRGLEIAEETCITVNNNGMMAIQHQVIHRDVGDGSPCFVDFIMCCLELDSDDEEEEQSHSPNSGQEDASQAVSQSHTQATYASNRNRSLATSQTQSVASQSQATCRNGHDNDSDSDGDDAQSHMMPSSVAPLFGSIVAEPSHNAGETPDSHSTRRKTRRVALAHSKKQSHRRQRKNRGGNGDDDSVGSSNLLASSESDRHDSSSSEEEESQPLDVTAMAASPPRKRTSLNDDRDSECSSPELVYGRRH